MLLIRPQAEVYWTQYEEMEKRLGNFDHARRIEQRRSLAFGGGLGSRGAGGSRGSLKGSSSNGSSGSSSSSSSRREEGSGSGVDRLFRSFEENGGGRGQGPSFTERGRRAAAPVEEAIRQVSFDAFSGAGRSGNVTLGALGMA